MSMGINLGNLAGANTESLNGVQKVDRGNGKISLAVKKGFSLDLSKLDNVIKRARIGLGWDSGNGEKSLRQKDNDVVDLDLMAVCVPKARDLEPSDVIYYRQRNTGKHVVLNKDNRNGEGEGDDEIIFVDLDKVPEDIDAIVFYATIYEADKKQQTFGKVKNAYIRLVNDETDKEELIYVLTENGTYDTSFYFAKLERNEDGSGWTYKSIGKGGHDDINDIANKYFYGMPEDDENE